ncbi:hypothetical protein Taro_050620, partial [Colocasia esculenta]|nr:hypothetical protein [Colocasia esculenta]
GGCKGVVIKEPQPERRSKFRHDPSKSKADSGPSGTPSKRGRSSPQSKGKSPMTSRYPRRKLLPDSSDSDEEGSSSESSSDTYGTPVVTPSQTATAGRSILKPKAVKLSDQAFADAFPEIGSRILSDIVDATKVFKSEVKVLSNCKRHELKHAPTFREFFNRTHKRKGTDDYVSESARMIAETYDRTMADRYAEGTP